MKHDLDAIMQAHDIDALLVTGPAQHNPAMVYFTGVRHLSMADLIKKRGDAPILFHTAMERGEAAQTGLTLRSYSTVPLREMFQQAKGDRVLAAALRYARMLADAGVSGGRVALYGQGDLSMLFPVFSELQRLLPDLQLVGDVNGMLLGAAMITKDAEEVGRIRHMGHVTTEVVARVADFLTSQAIREENLVDEQGQPVTIGRVKGLINLWLAELGAENPEGTIFAIGSDGGIPHSIGNPEQPICLGQPIVFDIYPCEAGGGYFYDFTRTWCLGYAPEPVQTLYNQVRQVFETITAELHMGMHYGAVQQRTCELFEVMGHVTVLTNPETEEGYVHSVGHGVGLNIHERPNSGILAPAEDILQPGVVITIEPGLYYPQRGMGVRLEDTFWARPEGGFEVIAPYGLDLVLPMKKG